jgi:anti-sigma factor RsiW
MSHGENEIRDDELHAYIDGALDPSRRLAIALYLTDHPSEAARAEMFRAQKEGVRALFDHVLRQPVPARLAELVWHRATRRARRHRNLAALGIAAIALAGAAGVAEQLPALRQALNLTSTVSTRHSVGTGLPLAEPAFPVPKRPRRIDL